MNTNFTILKIKNCTIKSFVLGLFFLFACSENFLKPEPLSFYAPENVLINETGLQAILDNALSGFRDEFCQIFNPASCHMKYSDVAVEGNTERTSFLSDFNNQMLPDMVYSQNAYTKIGWYWDDSYKLIKDCNTIISRIDDAEFSSEERKNALLGAAYFLRAYHYYSKTLSYGDVPLILEELTKPRVDFFTTSKESIWLKMIKDLEFASQYVPEADEVPGGQVTKAACKHLLAKYYLMEGRFDDAIRVTSEIIDGGVHVLVNERFGSDINIPEKDVIWDLHQVQNKSAAGNREGLLLSIDRLGIEGNYSQGTRTLTNYAPSFFDPGMIKTPGGANGMSSQRGLEIPTLEKFGRGYRTRPTGYSQRDIWIMDGMNDTLDYRHRTDNGNWATMEQYQYNNPDLKGTEWYGAYARLYSSSGQLLCLDTIRCWFSWPYYKLFVPDPERSYPVGGNGDWYIYRLAETYLLRAEAYVWKGQWQNAANDINKIRQRANAQYMYTANDIQQQQTAAILDERARELNYEELRKAELTRMSIIYARTGIACYNGKTYSMDRISEDNFWFDRVEEISEFYNKNVINKSGHTYTCSPHHIFWPIPSYAINANTGGIINQNKGYPGEERNVPPLVYEGD